MERQLEVWAWKATFDIFKGPDICDQIYLHTADKETMAQIDICKLTFYF